MLKHVLKGFLAMKTISIIVPCYKEEEALPYFWEETSKVTKQMEKDFEELRFEFIFVDDGSSDNTLKVLKELAAKDNSVKYVSFSRNFGKEAAIYAGLQKSTGDYVAMMDADLQDPPSLLPEMYKTLLEGEFDCVATRRVTRKGEPPIRSLCARIFYKLMRKISNADIVDGARDFRLMTRTMVDSILSVKEYNRFSKGIFGWVGFKTKWLEYENVERVKGETKWSFWKLLFYSIDGIVAFSTAPLAISSIAGIVFCIISFLGIIFTIVRQLIWPGSSAFGWASTICILLFVSGIQMFCMGILGQYMSKTYLEVKDRPIYIVKEDNIDK